MKDMIDGNNAALNAFLAKEEEIIADEEREIREKAEENQQIEDKLDEISDAIEDLMNKKLECLEDEIKIHRFLSSIHLKVIHLSQDLKYKRKISEMNDE